MSEAGRVIVVSVESWISQVQAALRADRQPMTLPRLLILRWMAGQERPFCAEALAAGTAARATNYRAVDWLREPGWLAPVQTQRGDHAYARTLPGQHHSFGLCKRCQDNTGAV